MGPKSSSTCSGGRTSNASSAGSRIMSSRKRLRNLEKRDFMGLVLGLVLIRLRTAASVPMDILNTGTKGNVSSIYKWRPRKRKGTQGDPSVLPPDLIAGFEQKAPR